MAYLISRSRHDGRGLQSISDHPLLRAMWRKSRNRCSQLRSSRRGIRIRRNSSWEIRGWVLTCRYLVIKLAIGSERHRGLMKLNLVCHQQTKVIVAENFSFRQLNKKKISYPILSYSIHPWHQGHRLPDLLSKDVNGGPRPATRWVFTLLGYQYGVKPVPMGT